MFTPPPPEFSRPVTVERLRAEGGASIAAEADDAERAALTRRFNLPEIRALSVEAEIAPLEPGGWRVRGVVRARLRQTCVVTLEPVESALDERFDRSFLPAAHLAQCEGDEDADEDGPEPLGDEVDVGEIAAETAALAIDPYPRKPGVVFEGRRQGPPGAEPLDEAAAKPFARLAALRPRPSRD